MVKFCTNHKSLVGKVAIITGANTGIGYETALEFAKRGGRIIMACRNLERASAARDQIVKATGNENVVIKILDLESMKGVREFAEDINANESRLDVLVNNAGAADLPDKITTDGLQLEMAVNYFSHFLLTNLLLDLLKKSAPSRVINVSSSMAKFIRNLDLNGLNKHAGMSTLYSRTKLCNIYFTQELAKKLEGSGVSTYSLHPGAVATEFQRFSKFGSFVASLLFLTPEQGAQTQIFLSLEPDIEQYNGQHFENCKRVNTYCSARDSEKATKLWEISEQMVGLK